MTYHLRNITTSRKDAKTLTAEVCQGPVAIGSASQTPCAGGYVLRVHAFRHMHEKRIVAPMTPINFERWVDETTKMIRTALQKANP